MVVGEVHFTLAYVDSCIFLVKQNLTGGMSLPESTVT